MNKSSGFQLSVVTIKIVIDIQWRSNEEDACARSPLIWFVLSLFGERKVDPDLFFLPIARFKWLKPEQSPTHTLKKTGSAADVVKDERLSMPLNQNGASSKSMIDSETPWVNFQLASSWNYLKMAKRAGVICLVSFLCFVVSGSRYVVGIEENTQIGQEESGRHKSWRSGMKSMCGTEKLSMWKFSQEDDDDDAAVCCCCCKFHNRQVKDAFILYSFFNLANFKRLPHWSKDSPVTSLDQYRQGGRCVCVTRRS